MPPSLASRPVITKAGPRNGKVWDEDRLTFLHILFGEYQDFVQGDLHVGPGNKQGHVSNAGKADGLRIITHWYPDVGQDGRSLVHAYEKWGARCKDKQPLVWRTIDRPNRFNLAPYTQKEMAKFARVRQDIQRAAAALNIPLHPHTRGRATQHNFTPAEAAAAQQVARAQQRSNVCSYSEYLPYVGGSGQQAPLPHPQAQPFPPTAPLAIPMPQAPVQAPATFPAFVPFQPVVPTQAPTPFPAVPPSPSSSLQTQPGDGTEDTVPPDDGPDAEEQDLEKHLPMRHRSFLATSVDSDDPIYKFGGPVMTSLDPVTVMEGYQMNFLDDIDDAEEAPPRVTMLCSGLVCQACRPKISASDGEALPEAAAMASPYRSRPFLHARYLCELLRFNDYDEKMGIGNFNLRPNLVIQDQEKVPTKVQLGKVTFESVGVVECSICDIYHCKDCYDEVHDWYQSAMPPFKGGQNEVEVGMGATQDLEAEFMSEDATAERNFW